VARTYARATVRVLTVGNRYPATGGGGYEAVWRALVAHLRADGDDVEVLACDEPGAPLPGVHRELPWYWEDGRWKRGILAARKIERGAIAVLDRHLERFAPDLVVWVSMGGLPLTLIGRPEAPQAALIHDGWPVYGAKVDPRARRHGWSSETVAVWSCNSAFVRDRCAEALGPQAAARMRVDPPGIDPERFAPAAAAPWQGRLAVIGRVEERKGVADAVRALPHLPACTLTVTGPPERGFDLELLELGRGLGVDERLVVAPAAGDVRAAYAHADAVLFPVTWEEPFGLVPLEAMSVGRPVVATGTGGASEYLRDEDNCLLVPPREPQMLAQAVARLAGDPALRARLVASGSATAARFTEAGWCERVAGAIRGLVAGGGPHLGSGR